MANKNYSDLDKAAVRTLASSGMGIKEIERRSNISRNTIREWIRDDDDSNVSRMADFMTAGTLQELKALHSTCVREMIKRVNSGQATNSDVLRAMDTTFQSMLSLKAAAKPEKAREESESDYWRGVVSRLLMRAQSRGEVVTYEQAVEKVVDLKPEAKPFLLVGIPETPDE